MEFAHSRNNHVVLSILATYGSYRSQSSPGFLPLPWRGSFLHISSSMFQLRFLLAAVFCTALVYSQTDYGSYIAVCNSRSTNVTFVVSDFVLIALFDLFFFFSFSTSILHLRLNNLQTHNRKKNKYSIPLDSHLHVIWSNHIQHHTFIIHTLPSLIINARTIPTATVSGHHQTSPSP